MMYRSSTAAAVALAVGYPPPEVAAAPRQNKKDAMDGPIVLEVQARPASACSHESAGPIAVPPSRPGALRSREEERRLALVPDIDIALKRKAVDLFLADELWENLVPSSEGFDAARIEARRLQNEICSIRALTPGGIAYRLDGLLSLLEQTEQTSDWITKAVRAALDDALEQERLRMSALNTWFGSSGAVVPASTRAGDEAIRSLYGAWLSVNHEIEVEMQKGRGLPCGPESEAHEDRLDRLVGEQCRLEHQIIKAPSPSLEGLLIKLTIVGRSIAVYDDPGAYSRGDKMTLCVIRDAQRLFGDRVELRWPDSKAYVAVTGDL